MSDSIRMCHCNINHWSFMKSLHYIYLQGLLKNHHLQHHYHNPGFLLEALRWVTLSDNFWKACSMSDLTHFIWVGSVRSDLVRFPDDPLVWVWEPDLGWDQTTISQWFCHKLLQSQVSGRECRNRLFLKFLSIDVHLVVFYVHLIDWRLKRAFEALCLLGEP